MTNELVKNYACLRSEVLIIKHLLYKHRLNSVYKGGLSSYSLVLWVVAYLNSLSVIPEDYGEILIGFLEFYGK